MKMGSWAQKKHLRVCDTSWQCTRLQCLRSAFDSAVKIPCSIWFSVFVDRKPIGSYFGIEIAPEIEGMTSSLSVFLFSMLRLRCACIAEQVFCVKHQMCFSAAIRLSTAFVSLHMFVFYFYLIQLHCSVDLNMFFFFIKLKFLCASLWNNNAFDLLIYAILNVLSFLASFKLSLEFQTNATRTRFVFSTNANSIYITQLLQSFSHSVHRHRRSLVACNTHIVRMENGKVR